MWGLSPGPDLWPNGHKSEYIMSLPLSLWSLIVLRISRHVTTPISSLLTTVSFMPLSPIPNVNIFVVLNVNTWYTKQLHRQPSFQVWRTSRCLSRMKTFQATTMEQRLTLALSRGRFFLWIFTTRVIITQRSETRSALILKRSFRTWAVLWVCS